MIPNLILLDLISIQVIVSYIKMREGNFDCVNNWIYVNGVNLSVAWRNKRSQTSASLDTCEQ